MTRYLDKYNRKASIADWELKITLLNHEQLSKFISDYMELGLYPDLHIETEIGDSFNPDKYITTIKGCWAYNLKEVSELLEKHDYKDDTIEQDIEE